MLMFIMCRAEFCLFYDLWLAIIRTVKSLWFKVNIVGVMYFYVFFTRYYFFLVSGLPLFPIVNRLERLRTGCGRNMPCS